MKKILKFKNETVKFIERYHILIIFIIIALALECRLFFMDYISSDYELFLGPWSKALEAGGGLSALRDYPGDYNAPYMTIMALLTYIPIISVIPIKIVSILFDFVGAIATSLIVYEIFKNNPNRRVFSIITLAITLFLPTVLLNSSLWGQCDSIYTSFVLLSLLFLIKEKYIKSFIFFGIAFAFKFQSVFILPLYVILYFSKGKFSIFHFLLIPVMNFILCIPAILYGKPIWDLLTVYFHQAQTYSNALVMYFPNLYYLIHGDPSYMYPLAIGLMTLAFATMLFYIVLKDIKWNNEKIISLGLWSIVIATFLLPGMHERYLYTADILSIVYYICYRKNLSIVLIIQVVSIYAYMTVLIGCDLFFLTPLAAIYLIIILYFTRNIVCTLRENKV